MEYSNLPASDLSFATANTKQSSSIESENTPRHTINNKAETSHSPQQDIHSKGLSEESSNHKNSIEKNEN